MTPNWSEPQQHRSGRWINGTSPCPPATRPGRSSRTVCWQARDQADTSSHAGVIEASAEHLSSRSSTPHFARSSQALDPRGYRARSAHLSVNFVRASSRGLHGRKSGLRVVCGPRCRGTWLPTTPRAPPLPRCGLVHNNEDPVPDSSSSDRVEPRALIFVNLSVNFTAS
jgi:hypothetical protein